MAQVIPERARRVDPGNAIGVHPADLHVTHGEFLGLPAEHIHLLADTATGLALAQED